MHSIHHPLPRRGRDIDPQAAGTLSQLRIEAEGRAHRCHILMLSITDVLDHWMSSAGSAIDDGDRLWTRPSSSRSRASGADPPGETGSVRGFVPSSASTILRSHSMRATSDHPSSSPYNRSGSPVDVIDEHLSTVGRSIEQRNATNAVTLVMLQILPHRRGDVCPGAGPRPARRNPRQWGWPWRPRVSTGVAPGRVHCGTGRLVGPQVATPSASERQNQPIGEPCPPTGESAT